MLATDYTERRVDGELKYSGVIVDVYLDRAQLVDGKIVKREVVRHPGGVTVLPVDGEGFCYLVRQYRYPVGRMMLEAPAGKLEYGEDHRACAERELSEETGFSSEELIYLGGCYSSPGFSTEKLHMYLALGLRAGQQHLDEGEYLNLERHSLEELTELISDGKIEDAKTVAIAFKALKYLESHGADQATQRL